jgi:hypothetical protein
MFHLQIIPATEGCRCKSTVISSMPRNVESWLPLLMNRGFTNCVSRFGTSPWWGADVQAGSGMDNWDSASHACTTKGIRHWELVLRRQVPELTIWLWILVGKRRRTEVADPDLVGGGGAVDKWEHAWRHDAGWAGTRACVSRGAGRRAKQDVRVCIGLELWRATHARHWCWATKLGSTCAILDKWVATTPGNIIWDVPVGRSEMRSASVSDIVSLFTFQSEMHHFQCASRMTNWKKQKKIRMTSFDGDENWWHPRQPASRSTVTRRAPDPPPPASWAPAQEEGG